MRWPWQRGTDQPRTDRAPRQPALPAAVEPRVAPAGWAFLPPLQRSAGNIQLTSDPDHFTGSMTHLVSLEAPAGVIDVDGGGPVPGSGNPATSSVEMTLLPPPAPRVRPAPGRLGGMPTTVQRTGPDGGALDGTRLDGGTPDGGTLNEGSNGGSSPPDTSLLAAAPDAFAVLHVDAAPPQSPGLTPGSRVSPAESPVDTSVPARPEVEG